MKKALLLLSLILGLISCEKLEDLKTVGVIPGGCNLENKGFPIKGLLEDVDKVTYSIENGNLKIFVGFNATCCSKYSASSETKDNVILISIKTIQPGLCNCICYYTYDFTFSGTGENYNYKVNIDNRLIFTGKIKL